MKTIKIDLDYDEEADAAYIYLPGRKEPKIPLNIKTKVIDDYTNFDYSLKKLIGIEILNAKETLNL